MRRPNNVVSLGAAPTGPIDPDVADAIARVREADTTVLRCEGTLRVAEALLAELTETTPPVSPRAISAEQRVELARDQAHTAASRVVTAQRRVADADGALEAAEAILAHLQQHDGVESRLITATLRADKAKRSSASARDKLLDAQERSADAESRLSAAEQDLDAARAHHASPAVTVIAAEVAVGGASRALDDARAALTDARREHAAAIRRAVASASGPESPRAPYFASLDAFVEEYLLPNWRHQMTSTTHWCTYWWRHAEAITRLEALWEAFEVLRLQPAPALSALWRDHIDPHMRALTDETGTFNRCSTRPGEPPAHQLIGTWASAPAPDGLFCVDPDAEVKPQRIRHQKGASA
ncbi:MAG: DUF4913 domain-containing protein [Propionibacterium sp.]|nr:DUF4913 domain-containing protein [Propionibacterium sp.]